MLESELIYPLNIQAPSENIDETIDVDGESEN
jgi:hypothetical protein